MLQFNISDAKHVVGMYGELLARIFNAGAMPINFIIPARAMRTTATRTLEITVENNSKYALPYFSVYQVIEYRCAEIQGLSSDLFFMDDFHLDSWFSQFIGSLLGNILKRFSTFLSSQTLETSVLTLRIHVGRA
jgi:hypothetical protein